MYKIKHGTIDVEEKFKIRYMDQAFRRKKGKQTQSCRNWTGWKKVHLQKALEIHPISWKFWIANIIHCQVLAIRFGNLEKKKNKIRKVKEYLTLVTFPAHVVKACRARINTHQMKIENEIEKKSGRTFCIPTLGCLIQFRFLLQGEKFCPTLSWSCIGSKEWHSH